MWLAIQTRSDVMNRQIFDLAIEAISDPDEAWSVKDPLLQSLGHAPSDWIAPHVSSIIPYLNHQDWWLQNAALVPADTRGC